MKSASLADLADYDAVGFDLDGTLYDEFEFIRPAYASIMRRTRRIAWSCPPGQVLGFMCDRWLEKGSSYPHIFEEAYDGHAARPDPTERSRFVEDAVASFRSAQPDLVLAERATFVLERLRPRTRLFLVSDGNPGLQRRKFDVLRLGRFFEPDHVVLTGTLGPGGAKPNPKIPAALPFDLAGCGVAFVGDRDVDRELCRKVGWDFLRVHAMRELS